MRKITEGNLATTTDLKLTNIKISKPELQIKRAEKELDMMAWGFQRVAKNLPPVTVPDKKIKRKAPGASQYVYDRSEVKTGSWGSFLKEKIDEIKEDILYRHDIAESKREQKRDLREMKRMEKTDKHDMTKLKMLAFLSGGAIS